MIENLLKNHHVNDGAEVYSLFSVSLVVKRLNQMLQPIGFRKEEFRAHRNLHQHWKRAFGSEFLAKSMVLGNVITLSIFKHNLCAVCVVLMKSSLNDFAFCKSLGQWAPRTSGNAFRKRFNGDALKSYKIFKNLLHSVEWLWRCALPASDFFVLPFGEAEKLRDANLIAPEHCFYFLLSMDETFPLQPSRSILPARHHFRFLSIFPLNYSDRLECNFLFSPIWLNALSLSEWLANTTGLSMNS